MTAVARSQWRVALVALATGVLVLGGFALWPRADVGADGGIMVWPSRGLGVVAFGIDGALGRWSVTRGDAGWVVDDPEGAPADPTRVRRILHALDEGRSAPALGAPAAGMGFDAPTTLWVRDDRGRRTQHTVGGRAAVADRTYLRLPEGEVVAVRGGLYALLEGGTPVDLRLAQAADEVSVRLGDAQHRLARDEDGWRWAQGGIGNAEAWGWALHEARVRPAELGVRHGSVVVEARGARCELGSGGSGEASAWIVRCEDGRAGTLDGAALVELLQTAR